MFVRDMDSLVLPGTDRPHFALEGCCTHELPAGGQLVCQVQRDHPVVAIYAWVHAGAFHERPPREAGIAHMVEHMLFKGAKNQKVGDLALQVESSGGSLNAWTSHDETVLHAAGPSSVWKTILAAITDAALHPVFDADELEREKEVVLEEIRHGENSPVHRVSDRIFELSYPDGGYGRPILGTSQSVRDFTRRDLVNFHRRWYTPANMTFIVVGDIDPQLVAAELTDRLPPGKPVTPRKPRSRKSGSTPEKSRLEILTGPTAEAYLFFSLPLPAYDFSVTPALDLLSVILGEGESSRIRLSLKHKRELVLDAMVSAFTPRGPGLFMGSAIFSPENTKEVFAAFSEELAKLPRISPADLKKAQVTLFSEQVAGLQTVQGMARILGFFQGVTGDYSSLARYDEALAEASCEQLEQLAADLVARPVTAVLLLPEDGPVDRRGLQKSFSRHFPVRRSVSSVAVVKTEPDVQEYRIPGGPKLIVLPNSRLPIVSVRAGFAGGLLRENKHVSGITPLTAGLLTRGTGAISGDAIFGLIENQGGVFQAFSGRNSMGLRLDVLREGCDLGLSLLCRSLRFPAFFEEEVRKERELSCEAVRSEADQHSTQVMRLFERARYGDDHCCALNVTGDIAALKKMSRTKILRFYREQYPMTGGVFVVTGDVEPDRVHDLVCAELSGADLKPAPELDRTAPAIPVRQKAYAHKALTQNHLVAGFPGVDLYHPDRFPLEIASRILDGQSGRLFLDLRDTQGLAYHVSCFSLEGLAPGSFVSYMVTRPEEGERAMQGLLSHFARLRDTPPSEEEVERTKQYMIGTHDLGLQRNSAIAAAAFFGDLYGIGWNSYMRYRKALESVTPDDIKRVARKYFQPHLLITAVYGPRDVAVDPAWI